MSAINRQRPASLEDIYQTATAAAKDTSLSGENTVLVGSLFKVRKWQTLGSRTTEFKEANTIARDAFLSAVCKEFGGFSRIPESVRKALQLNDFKLSGRSNEVTSKRPLTARRIKLVYEAVKAYKESNLDSGVESVLTANVPAYDKLPKDLREAYRAELQKGFSTRDVVDQAKKLPLAKFLFEKFEVASYSYDIQQTGMCEVDAQKLKNFIGTFGTTIKWDDPKACALALEVVSVIELLRDEKCKSTFFKPVLDATQNWPAKHRAAAFQHVMQKFYSNVMSTLEARGADILNDTTNAQGQDYSLEELSKKINVAKLCGEIKTDGEAEVDFNYEHAFMREYVEQYKDEFSRVQGRKVKAFKGEQTNNKYENITEGIRIIKELYENKKYIRKDLGGLALEFQNKGAAYQEAVETYDKKKREFEQRQNQAKEEGREFTEKFKAKPFACAMTQVGKMVCDEITRITRVDSHGKSYTPTVMLNAFDIFVGVVDDFYKVLDLDRQRGNDKMFGKLMDALNVRACLPARVDYLTDIREELETGKVSVEFNRKFDVMKGVGAAIQMLQNGNADMEVDYEAMVDKYVELMMQRTQDDKDPAQVKWVPGTTKLGVNIPDLQLTKDSQVTITREFLMEPKVSEMLKEMLPYFKEVPNA